ARLSKTLSVSLAVPLRMRLVLAIPSRFWLARPIVTSLLPKVAMTARTLGARVSMSTALLNPSVGSPASPPRRRMLQSTTAPAPAGGGGGEGGAHGTRGGCGSLRGRKGVPPPRRRLCGGGPPPHRPASHHYPTVRRKRRSRRRRGYRPRCRSASTGHPPWSS